MSKNKDYNINIMMMGGRRCGKSSVLASMEKCFDERFGTSNLTINPYDNATALDFTNKINEINGYYNNPDKYLNFTPDSNPTKDLSEYKMNLSLKNKNNGEILMNFIDFPGEWIAQKENIAKLNKPIQDSHVIIIAIDTPHLMEYTKSEDPDAVGKFNDAANQSALVSMLLKKHLDLNSGIKMILFVPLKCEKYRNNGSMPLVIRKIKSAYSSLINHINNDINGNKCVMAITPIITLGTVEFKRFKRTEEGKIKVSPNTKLPLYPLYGFTDEAKDYPEPMYCEVPLIYTLMYVLTIAKEAKEKKHHRAPWFVKAMRRLGESFLKFPSANDFLLEINGLNSEITKYINKNEEGFELLTNPLNWK